MKKTLALVLALVLVLCAAPAFAAGRLNVEQENFIITNGYSMYGYVYGKVANVGDKPMEVSSGIMEIFDAEGDVITSEDYMNAYAKYLQPGEYTYVRLYEKIEDVEESDVDDYLLTVTGKSSNDYVSVRLPVVTEWAPNTKSGYSTYDYMYATVTNDTDSTIYDVNVVFALLDEEGNILYIDSGSVYNVGLEPGSTITFREYVDSSFKEVYEKNEVVPATVDAIAFVNVRVD